MLTKNILYFTLAKNLALSAYEIPQNKDLAFKSILDFKLGEQTSTQITNHGCWCSKMIATDEPTPSGKHSDGLDLICKNWIKARRCNDQLNGGSCFMTDTKDYFYQIDGDGFEGVEMTTCRETHSSGERDFNECEADSCTIDNYFSEQIFNYLLETQNESENDIFQPSSCKSSRSSARELIASEEELENETSSNKLPGTHHVVSCVGEAPFLKVSGTSKAQLTNPRFSNGKFLKTRKWNLEPNHAIDGIINSDDIYNSMACSDSNVQGENNFTVDLKQPCPISKVVIYPRRDNRCPKNDYCQSRYRVVLD